MSKRKPITSERATALIKTAAEEWTKQFETPEQVAVFTRKFLDAQMTSAIPAVLGFEKRWGDRWEIITTNGFREYSIVCKEIDALARKAAIEWVNAALQAPLPTDAALLKAARAEYRDAFEERVLIAARDMGERDGNEMVTKVLEQLGEKP